MKNCRTKGSDSALQSSSLAKLISIKFLGVRGYLQRGEWRHYPVISASVGGEWDTNVVQISMKECRTKGSDSALESPLPTKLVSIKFLGVLGYLRGGGWRHYPPVISASVGGEWDTNVVQISMKECRTKGSDSALESPSLTKLISINFSGVRRYLFGRGELT